MSAVRRTAGAAAAMVLLSGLVGAAAGCAGASSSGGASTGGGGAQPKALAQAAGGVALGPGAGERADRTGHAAARTSIALSSVPPVRSAVIKTATLELRVRHGQFGNVMDAAGQIATRFGGFVSRRSSSGTRLHDGRLVLRVPVHRFDQARIAVEHLGRPTDESVVGQDVTQQFVNLDARLGNLRSQQRALRQLMRRAVTVSDTIRVQGVLQNVELQIEEIQGQLIYLGNRTAMSTISIDVHEAGARPAPPEHASALWQAAAQSLRSATTVVTGVIVGAGFVIPLAILALLVVLIARLAAPWAAPLAARMRGPARTPPE